MNSIRLGDTAGVDRLRSALSRCQSRRIEPVTTNELATQRVKIASSLIKHDRNNWLFLAETQLPPHPYESTLWRRKGPNQPKEGVGMYRRDRLQPMVFAYPKETRLAQSGPARVGRDGDKEAQPKRGGE